MPSSAIETSDDIDIDELEKLIALAEEQDKDEQKQLNSFVPRLKEDDTFAKSFEDCALPSTSKPNEKSIVDENLDSSDDEEVRNFLERKYNEYGRDINKKLKEQSEEKKDARISREIDGNFKSSLQNGLSNSFSNRSNLGNDEKSNSLLFNKNKTRDAHPSPPLAPIFNIGTKRTISKNMTTPNPVNNLENRLISVYTDPVFGMRLVNPLISSSMLTERMSDRKAVGFSSIEFHIQSGDLSKDWVIAGAILSKSPVKTSKNGASYSIWRLSDLKGDIKTISLFLFKSAHKELWKTATGIVIAILNPGVFEKRAEKNDVACLCIDNPQKVMILGQSKDMGTCKAKKKNGEPCTAVVNLGECDYCVFHVKQEYGKMSKRSELQSSTAGRGLNELRNKVLGKSEVFYGGQSYTAIPAKKSAKQTAKDQKRLMTLSDYFQSPNTGNINYISGPKVKKEIPYASRSGPCSKVASNVESNVKQRLKDLERLKILKGGEYDFDQTNNTEPENNTQSSTITALIPEKYKGKEFGFSSKCPTLSKDGFSFEVNVPSKSAEIARQKALKIIKNKPIKKSDPNLIKYRGTDEGKKRAIAELDNSFENDSKKAKLEHKKEEERKTRIQRIMEATSSHTNLIQAKEDEEQEKYFNKLEKKEAMEEKMLNTYKVPCKAVICLKCKYTSFSAADRCKEEKHPLKVLDAEKRFFQCQDCGNRTATVHKIPKLSCKNCRGSRWQRSAMIKERKTIDPTAGLSIRGDEEKFLGTLNTSINLNLLVPDD